MKLLSFVLLITLSKLCFSSDVAQNFDGNCIPSEWNVDEMMRTITLNHILSPQAEPRVLIWKSRVDDRPLYVDSAILWIKDEKHWVLAHVFRHPRDTHAKGWESSIVYDSISFEHRVFDHPPTAEEIRSYIDDTNWNTTISTTFKLINGAVCDTVWMEITGENPKNLIVHP